MLDGVGVEISQVVRDLLVACFVYGAFKLARDAAKASGRLSALWRGWAWCLGLALFAAVVLGRPSCNDSDPMFGGCAEYADNGFEPSNNQRGLQFLYFALLLGLPVTLGALDDKFTPWRRPQKRA